MRNPNQASWGAFILLSARDDNAATQATTAIHFDKTSAESWSITQEVPEYAVANQKIQAQRIVGNTLFRASFSVTETPSKEQRFDRDVTGVPWDLDTVVIPADTTGEGRCFAVREALEEHLGEVWTLYTTRHGTLRDMVITSVDADPDGPKRAWTFNISFQRYRRADVRTVTVQASARAKKVAKEEPNYGETILTEEDLGTSTTEDIDILGRIERGPGNVESVTDSFGKTFDSTVLDVLGISVGAP